MPEIFRTRDCVVMQKGRTTTVSITPEMATAGWTGGMGVAWAPDVQDGFLVGISDGQIAGFALWGSDESSDMFTAMTSNQPTYQFVVIGFSGWIIMTISFETYTYASRIGPGPLVPIVYSANDTLYFSLNGKWTIENEYTLSGDPRAPNPKTGFVVQYPRPNDNGILYLTVQVAI